MYTLPCDIWKMQMRPEQNIRDVQSGISDTRKFPINESQSSPRSGDDIVIPKIPMKQNRIQVFPEICNAFH